jgi:hypothetical protein
MTMTKSQKLKIVSIVIIILAALLLISDLLEGDATFINLYLHGGMLLVGGYFFYLARKRQRLSGPVSKRKPVSLRLFIILASLGLVVTFFVLHYLGAYPIWIIAASVGITAILLTVIALIVRIRGYLP